MIINGVDTMRLSEKERLALALLLVERDKRHGCTFRTYFPDCVPGQCRVGSERIEDHVIREGFKRPTCRCLYPRSLLFFAAGALHRERLFLAANRTSKTVSAAFEITCHLTGDYPAWWPGRRYEAPVQAWGAGDTTESTRNVIQNELCGPHELVKLRKYAGMVPAHLIVDRTLKSGGVPDCLDAIYVQHKERVHGAPALSTFEFKAYNQGRLSFQGTTKKIIWLDEEPPDVGDDTPSGGGTPSGAGDIYTECLLRTATEDDGMVIATFTPLRGLTPFVDEYLNTAVMCDAFGTVVEAKTGIFGEATS